jgi:uncharacterized protein
LSSKEKKLKIDIYSHILPEKYLAALIKKNPKVADTREATNRAVVNLETRFKLMERYPDVLQVLTISLPTLNSILKPEDSVELARIANDELAELIVKYPNKFIAGVASLPFLDMDSALKETDRAIKQLGLKGIQIFVGADRDQLDDIKFKPLFDKMAGYDLPIWIHPCSDGAPNDGFFGLFGWPYVTSNAMMQLVTAGVFNDHPDIKYLMHHCGGMIPYFAGRINKVFPSYFEYGNRVRNWGEHFRKFYTDSATYGNTSALICGYDYFGADHLLFGTDAPLPSPCGLTLESINSVQRMEIPELDKEKIFYGNAIKLLGIAL